MWSPVVSEQCFGLLPHGNDDVGPLLDGPGHGHHGRWISDPSCHLAEPRIVGVVEGEQEGGAMPAPAEGPAQGGAAEAIDDRRWG